MKKLIFATGNENKMKEIRMILADLKMEVLSQKEAGIKADVIENGSTFEENAAIKAAEVARIAASMPGYEDAVIMADDSGLEIDRLNKEPGIYSARYMGRIPLMILRTGRLLTVSRECLTGKGRQGSYVPLQQYFRMEAAK